MGNISGTTAARASKFCVVLWLKPSNIVLLVSEIAVDQECPKLKI